jgi:hypothetical protein
MKAFANSLQHGFDRKPCVTAIKTMLRKSKIIEFKTHLENAKTTLLMAINLTTLLMQ